jgi:uncharacterized membrane protein YdcZ (DUF606 family)
MYLTANTTFFIVILFASDVINFWSCSANAVQVWWLWVAVVICDFHVTASWFVLAKFGLNTPSNCIEDAQCTARWSASRR